MSGVEVIAYGAVSGLGRGRDAVPVPALDAPAPTAIRADEELAAAGLRRTKTARVAALSAPGDRAAVLLAAALEQICGRLDEEHPGWRGWRVGLCVGSSSGGMLVAEQLFRARAAGAEVPASLAAGATYFAPVDGALRRAGAPPLVRVRQVLAACASSTLAIGAAMRWLQRGACDLVLAGGYDGLSVFVAAGFEALRATSASMPRPFQAERDGMFLGEGAGIVALALPGTARTPLVRITGFGASADATHITAPDRAASGLIRAGSRALADAGLDPARVGLVSVHGTSTPYNDAMEARAVAALCPTDPVVHAFKPQIGHTLGAAGVLEALVAAEHMRAGRLPATLGEGDLDPDARVRLLRRTEPGACEAALKLSAAFGGVSAALVLQTTPSGPAAPRQVRPVRVLGHAAIDDVDLAALAAATGMARDRAARIDGLSLLALAAVASLVGSLGQGCLEGAGVVGGYALATLDTNEAFHARLLEKGARWVDPRRFPGTTPNAGPGHVAIAYGLHGPNFAVCSGLCGSLEALVAAAELVASGDAERMVVVAADEHGPASEQVLSLLAPGRAARRGAAAVLLGAGAGPGRTVDLDLPVDHGEGPVGHLALLGWLEAEARQGAVREPLATEAHPQEG